VSTLTISSEKILARASRQALTKSLASSSLGRLIFTARCPPLPESARIKAPTGQPIDTSRSLMSLAFCKAAVCSSSLELMPEGLMGSKSIGNHRRSIISASDVVSLAYRVYLFADLAKRSGRTGLMVK